VRHIFVFAASAIALALLSITACGDDKVERGLTVGEEVATPSSDKAMNETQKERDRELDEELEDTVDR
jgi:hypothetical protein